VSGHAASSGSTTGCRAFAAAADIAFRQLAALTAEETGVAGELGAAVLQGCQRLAKAHGRDRGEVDVAILFTDLARDRHAGSVIALERP
jgi:hypothetical protein